MPVTPSALDPHPTAPHVATRQAHAEALLEEFAVAWLGHRRSQVTWAHTERAFEDLCARALLFLDPEGNP